MAPRGANGDDEPERAVRREQVRDTRADPRRVLRVVHDVGRKKGVSVAEYERLYPLPRGITLECRVPNEQGVRDVDCQFYTADHQL